MSDKNNKGFTPLEIQKRLSINLRKKRKPPFGSVFSITERSGKSLTGFTITELLVVIFIVSLLSAVVFANYRAGERQYALQRSANQLAQDIRRAQVMATATKEFEGQVPDGYGIYFEENNPGQYILFAYFEEGEPYRTVETLKFEERERQIIFISHLDTNLSAQTRRLRIIFLPPDPTVKIYSSASPSPVAPFPHKAETAEINLNYEGGPERTVKVNKAGLIEIE